MSLTRELQLDVLERALALAPATPPRVARLQQLREILGIERLTLLQDLIRRAQAQWPRAGAPPRSVRRCPNASQLQNAATTTAPTNRIANVPIARESKRVAAGSSPAAQARPTPAAATRRRSPCSNRRRSHRS